MKLARFGGIVSACALAAMGGHAQAADNCRARVLVNVGSHDGENFDGQGSMKKGEIWNNVTQFHLNKKTDTGIFCAHGDYCYPSHVAVAGKKVPAIQLLNCKIKGPVARDGDEEEYYVG